MAAKRSIKNQDSSGLLLDTVCNSFGGIILIALLIALTASSQVEDFKKEADKNRREQRKQDIEKAKAALDKIKKILAQMKGVDDLMTIAGKVESLVTLHETRDSLVDERDALRQRVANQNRLIKVLEQQARFGVDNLRLPMQQDSSRTPLPIIVFKNLAHPVILVEQGKLVPNQTSVRLVQGPGGLVAEPVDGGGLDEGALEKYISKLSPKQYYPVYVVYSDSFGVFDDFKRATARRSVSYAWWPIPVGEKVLLGPKGKKLPVE